MIPCSPEKHIIILLRHSSDSFPRTPAPNRWSAHPPRPPLFLVFLERPSPTSSPLPRNFSQPSPALPQLRRKFHTPPPAPSLPQSSTCSPSTAPASPPVPLQPPAATALALAPRSRHTARGPHPARPGAPPPSRRSGRRPGAATAARRSRRSRRPRCGAARPRRVPQPRRSGNGGPGAGKEALAVAPRGGGAPVRTRCICKDI